MYVDPISEEIMGKTTAHKRHVARHLREVDRTSAAQKRPTTRRRARAWLDPLRKALTDALSGEMGVVDDKPVVVLSRAKETIARVDHMLTSVASTMVRADPSAAECMQPLYTLAASIAGTGTMYADDVHAALVALRVAEGITIRTSPADLDAAIRDTRIEIEMRYIQGKNEIDFKDKE